MNANVHDDYVYGDSDFLAARDKTIHDFRSSEKDTKRKIIEKMLTLRHNMKYNKHLLSVYMRAKELFDTMVDEHRMQIHHLDEIYQHLNLMIRENLSEQRNKRANTMMMHELVKDKKRIGLLLKKMRASFDKLMNIDTVIGVTIDQINELTFMDDDAAEDDNDDSEAEDDDSDSEAEDDNDDSEAEDDDGDSDSDSEAEDDDGDSDSEDDDGDSEAEDDDGEAEDDDSEPEESENNKSVIYLF